MLQQAYTREHGLRVPVEVETRDLGEVREVLALLGGDAGVRVDRIMLDNMARRDASAPGAPARSLGAMRSQSRHAQIWTSWQAVSGLANMLALQHLLLAAPAVPVQR